MLDAIEGGTLARLTAAVARARARVWKWGLAPQRVTLDFDSTLVDVESKSKDQAAPNWKHGYGSHPLLVYLDQTGEVLVRSDSAWASHGFVDATVSRGMEFSAGSDVTDSVREAILRLPEESWVGATTKEMEELEGAEVAEITSLVDLSRWPKGSCVPVRREGPHPGASYNLFDPSGLHHRALIINSPGPDIAYLEARHRLHARVEDQIKDAKDCGLADFTCRRTSWQELCKSE